MAHRFRLYPTKDQEQHLLVLCADARSVWNLAVEQNNFSLRYGRRGGRQSWPTHKQRGLDLTEARSEDNWISVGSSMVQQQSLRDFDRAKQLAFKHPNQFRQPDFRKKHVDNGFNVTDVVRHEKVKFLGPGWAAVQIPGTGDHKACWVKVRLSRRFSVLKKSASFRVKLRNGEWHVSFVAEQAPLPRKNHGAVGVDVGIARSLTLSDGEYLDMPSTLKPGEVESRLRLQRKLARQTKGSKRRERTKQRIVKSYGKQAARRKDWIEKTTTSLVSQYTLIVVEDLNIKNMIRSAKGTKTKPGSRVAQKTGLNRSIQNQAWGMFRTRLEQKAVVSGAVVVAVPAAGTSQTCAECSHRSKENRESQAVFSCKRCGHSTNADVNAARNILARGLGLLDGEACSSKPVKRQSLAGVT